MLDQLTAMKVFVDVSRLGSLAAAADRQGMSRSMATRYVASLESGYGLTLLERNGRNLSLTREGRELLPYCERILALQDEMGQLVAQRMDSPTGFIRVACSPLLGHNYLAPALLRYMGRYRHVKVEVQLVYGDAIAFFEQQIDLALIVSRPARALAPHPHRVMQLSWHGLPLLASPLYAALRGTPRRPADLLQHNCLVNTRQGAVWQLGPQDAAQEALWEAEELRVAGDFASNDLLMLREQLLADRGIGCIPHYLVQEDLASGRLIRVLPDLVCRGFAVEVLCPSAGRPSAAVKSFLDFLQQDFPAARAQPIGVALNLR